VRLRYAYFVRCESVVKDEATGEILEVRCTYDPATRGGSAPDGRKVQSTLHWVSAGHSLPVEVRLYDRLFRVERPDLEEGGFEACLNPDSLETLTGSRIEPGAADPPIGERLQFERQGYFFRDPVDSRPDHLVFNRIVPLRDSWAPEAKPGPKPPEPTEKAPKEAKEAKIAEPLTAEELEHLDRLRPELEPVVDAVLAAHPAEAERYRGGKVGLLGFLIAQVMKRSGGTMPPKLVSALMVEKLVERPG
jgi:glutaminyl-tRNA synthetase